MRFKNMVMIFVMFSVPVLKAAFLGLGYEQSMGKINLLRHVGFKNFSNKEFSKLQNLSHAGRTYRMFRITFKFVDRSRGVFMAEEIPSLGKVEPGQRRDVNGSFSADRVRSDNNPYGLVTVGYFITSSGVGEHFYGLDRSIGDFIFRYDLKDGFFAAVALISGVRINGRRYNENGTHFFSISSIDTTQNGLCDHQADVDIFQDDVDAMIYIYNKLVLTYGYSVLPERDFDLKIHIGNMREINI
ncbi:MAG: hypothetical protein K2X39_07775 [Silvanigrellaceae bacterium]|nr:hypothetical protein [Silvanigrellaceae bacterium]